LNLESKVALLQKTKRLSIAIEDWATGIEKELVQLTFTELQFLLDHIQTMWSAEMEYDAKGLAELEGEDILLHEFKVYHNRICVDLANIYRKVAKEMDRHNLR